MNDLPKCPRCGKELKEVLEVWKKESWNTLEFKEGKGYKGYKKGEGSAETDWLFDAFRCPECFMKVDEVIYGLV